MSVINNNLLLTGDDGATGYQISRSVRLRRSATAYFSRTPANAGNRTTWTWSGWIKRGALGTTQMIFAAGANSPSGSTSSFLTGLLFSDTNAISLYWATSAAATATTTRVFRDTSAWYHIMCVANATTLTLYVNGETTQSVAISGQGAVNSTVSHAIGVTNTPGLAYAFDGYITEINFVDGQALTPSSFGETDVITGVWKPKAYGGTYGTNGFYLNFADNSNNTAATIGKDNSGNGHNWTPNNISVTAGVTYDSMIDTPTPYADGGNGRGNYAVLNPIGGGAGTISNGNLTVATSAATATVGNFAMTTGKWYWEVVLTTASNPRVGVFNLAGSNPAGLGETSASWAIINGPSRLYHNGATTSYGSFSGTSGDTVMVAYDADAGRIWYGENGTWFASGDPATNSNPSQTSVIGQAIVPASSSGVGSNTHNFNFGQRPFAYTPPTGFKALQTGNLPEPTIVDGSQYFDATIWSGDNTSSRTITNTAGFAPDFVWTKTRNVSNSHLLYDKLRGPSTSGSSKALQSNSTAAEGTVNDNSTNGYLSSFATNGFGVTKGSNDQYVNRSGNTYVAWQWKANGAAVSNTAGSITSQVSAGVAQGFSVVTYTGTGANATVGHGLGVAPKMVIVKNRSSAQNWTVFHANTGATNRLFLNTTDSSAASSIYWNNTAPTSGVFSVSTSPETNGSGNNLVAYCFSEVAGYSAFGSYTGNGSSDGTFVFCGFRPKYVLIKRTNASNDWYIHDTRMSQFNVAKENLIANSADSEGSGFNWLDMISNGFKCRTSDGGTNASGGTYIYVAFAEHPFKNALAR